MAFRTIFIESQCRCSYQGGYLVVRKTDDTKKIHLSAYLLAELAKCKISLVVADEKCNPIGQYLPLYGAHNASKRVTEQLSWGEPIKKRVWQQVVKEKIRQQARSRKEGSRKLRSRSMQVATRCGPATLPTGRPMRRACTSPRCSAAASRAMMMSRSTRL